MTNRKFYWSVFSILCIINLLVLQAFSAPDAPKDAAVAAGQKDMAQVSYELPADGPLPKTYLVTLAIVDPKNTDWIISTFIAGEPRTVTEENKGKFTETWDGLDENYMPVPPGEYAVKGIYMPAKKWGIDDSWHAVTPKFSEELSAWHPNPDEKVPKSLFGGDTCGSPMRDVAVGPNGVAVFHYQYLENGMGTPMFDLKKPIGPEQFIKAFPSGGAAGGNCATTDGETIWAFSTDGGPKYVYRPDGRSFGKSPGCNRANSYAPEGWVTAMACLKDETAKKTFVYIAQRGKIAEIKHPNWTDYSESGDEFINKITVHDGDDGKILATLPVAKPQGLSVLNGRLYVLHSDEKGYAVSSVKLQNGIPEGQMQTAFKVPASISPFDLETDSKGRFYLSDSKANKVYQLDARGKILLTYGKLPVQKPGTFDPESFMAPEKLATWKDEKGEDRLIIVEVAGPNRVTEWSTEKAVMLRDFTSFQSLANGGFHGLDPAHPEHLYIAGQQDWLIRFKGDYKKHTWSIDAVWPDVSGINKGVVIRTNGNLYIAGGQSGNVYRLAGDRWLLSAGIIRKEVDKNPVYFLWHDANGNGIAEDDEMTPAQMPGNLMTYHGQNWLEDLSFLAIGQGSRDVWRLTPEGFDKHGNPIFKEWKKVLTDPTFEARAKGVVDAIYGGNESGDNFSSDWMQADGSLKEGFWVQARSGFNFDANTGSQHKLSYYAPDKDGSFKQKWRVGRTALQWTARRGEIYGAMRIHRPINGLISVIDQTRCGVLLYTQDGLYVDTLFPDGRSLPVDKGGIYLLPGEFFVGSVFPNEENGKIYFCLGKYTPLLFEAEGWSLKENPVKPMKSVQKTVTLSSSQIASPPEIALSIRGGAGTAKLARFSPALGGAVLDGSMTGWETCEPVKYGSDKDQAVEVRCLYDADHVYLRWHARFSGVFEPKDLPPLPRIFTHDQLSNTLDFYFQGDPEAKPGSTNGRPGDARFVFGIFKNGGKTEPVGVGMYPSWNGKGQAVPQKYRTPVGEASFAHVGLIEGAKYGYVIDEDKKGYVLAVSIPRSAIPALKTEFGSKLRTLVNFSANFGGHNKFWWANSDASASKETYDEPSEARLYPGSWAPVQFKGIEKGITIRKWLICGPFGGPGAEKLTWDPNGNMPGTDKNWKDATTEFCEAQKYPPDDQKVDMKAVFKGEIIKGYWNDPGEVRWREANIAELDTRVILGGGGQVWYAAAWVFAPAATELEFEFQGHPQTFLRWFLNGEKIETGKYADVPSGHDNCLMASKTVQLRQGWNQIMFRIYCCGYSPSRAGLVLKGSPDKLWPLKLSAEPPQPK